MSFSRAEKLRVLLNELIGKFFWRHPELLVLRSDLISVFLGVSLRKPPRSSAVKRRLKAFTAEKKAKVNAETAEDASIISN